MKHVVSSCNSCSIVDNPFALLYLHLLYNSNCTSFE